ncbi:sigma 54-interacting transcriptional regulator [Bacillus sp. V5-8f]|nr:sigma 54-interacting transcriptional regulator [Bacillus sp. V5-8f]
MRIGDYIEGAINVRVFAATNRNIMEQIAHQGSFRSDLEDIESLSIEFLQ